MTKSWMSLVFTLAGIGFMVVHGLKKKKKMIKYFKDDERLVKQFKRKKAVFPGII